jgi:hypothetical protein
MNNVLGSRQCKPWVPSYYLNLDGFYVVAGALYDDNEQQEGLSFLVHQVFGWDDQLQEYSFCLFDADSCLDRSPCLGVWQGRTLTLYQESHDFYLRHTFQFISADQPDRPDCLYTMQIEVLLSNNEWELVAKGDYRRCPAEAA